MQILLNDLSQQIIISPKDIKTLKDDLLKQHPNYSNLQLAQLFSKALHHTLDEALYPFEGNVLRKLKFSLLRQNLIKDTFSITALDIVDAYTKLNAEDHLSMNPLDNWINMHQLGSSSLKGIHSLNNFDNSSYPTVFPSTATLIKQNRWLISISGCLLIAAASYFSLNINYQNELAMQNTFKHYANYSVSLPIDLELSKSANYLQTNLQYKEVNQSALKAWLENRHSLLASEPYFSTLMDTAKSYNINPLLLFSITGQEQGFVPSSHPYAVQMANNPFNLYGSWEDYNTDIKESAEIAARTIINLGKNCPEGEDQIKWINQSYAADPNWHIGVSYFLNELEGATKITP